LLQPAQQEAEELKLAALLVVETGLDPVDILLLRWEDVSLEEGVIQCRQDLFGARPRVHLDKQTVQRLARSRKSSDSRGSLFPHLTLLSAPNVFEIIKRTHGLDRFLANEQALVLDILDRVLPCTAGSPFRAG
jgi:integrase